MTILTCVIYSPSFIGSVVATNGASLAEIDIEIKIQPHLVECNITLDYAGQVSENTSSYDTLIIEGMVQNLSVTDGEGENLFYVTEVRGNATVVTYHFSHKLSIGESYSVTCRYYQNSTRTAKYQFEYTLDIDWPGSAGIERVVVLFEPGLDLLDSSNQPHFYSSKEGWLQLNWYETITTDFSSVFSFSRSPLSTLLIDPEEWDTGNVTVTDLPSILIHFTNDGEDTVEIQLVTEKWFDVNMTSFKILAGHHKAVRCWISTTRAGEYSGTLKIHTNISGNYIFTISITTVVEGQSGFDWFPLFLLALLIATVGVSVYIINKKRIVNFRGFLDRVASHPELDSGKEVDKISDMDLRKTETPPVIIEDPSVLPPGPEVVSRVDAMEDLLNEKEFQVLQVLLESNGISQQRIAELTGISKATVSRVVGRLLSKRLVEKRQLGMSNLIYLGERLTE
ncbi:MAG: MarR family transcriptional regulator [Candidatus Heimdallarchaeota archaeon]|nr:MAG: MarR family transcriptional regulator [Candidatus Heimdallarchaeota archaeon]